MSVRQDLAEMFRTDWAIDPALEDVRVIATEAALDDIHKPTALLRMNRMGRYASAPLSHRNVGMLLTLVSAHMDLDRAADEMDELVPAALDYLGPRFQHDDATAVAYGDRLAFDIPFTVIAANAAEDSE